MNVNMKDVIKHMARGDPPVVAWKKAQEDAIREELAQIKKRTDKQAKRKES